MQLGDYGEQGPTGNEAKDERAYGPECGAHFMGLRSEIGRKVQQPRHNISIEKDASEQERWPGRDEKKRGNQEERQVLQVIQLNAPNTLNALVGRKLLWIRFGVKGCLLKVLRRAKTAFYLHHANDSEPGHAHSLKDHEGSGDRVRGEDWVLEA